MGVPPSEFKGAFVKVDKKIGIGRLFNEQEFDVSKMAANTALTQASSQDGNRYSFLWDQRECLRRLEHSWMWPKVKEDLAQSLKLYGPKEQDQRKDELKLTCISIEERLKELAGAIQLAHSSYYGNDEVIRRIGRFLETGQMGDSV